MSLLSRLLSRPWRRNRRRDPQPLPGEPDVFECQSCGKVFDAAHGPVRCPECDSVEVLVLTR